MEITPTHSPAEKVRRKFDQLRGLFQQMREDAIRSIELRVEIGEETDEVISQSTYGNSDVAKFAEEVDIKAGTLRAWHSVATGPYLQRHSLDEFFAEYEPDEVPKWTHLRDKNRRLKGGKDEGDELSEIEFLKDEVEREGYKLDRKATKLQRLSKKHGDEEAVRQAGFILQRLQETKLQAENVKPTTFRCRKHLDWVADQGCIVSGVVPADPHHMLPGGMGMKCSDLLTAGLSRKHHGEIEDHGLQWFEDKYNVNVWKQVALLLDEAIQDPEMLEAYLKAITKQS